MLTRTPLLVEAKRDLDSIDLQRIKKRQREAGKARGETGFSTEIRYREHLARRGKKTKGSRFVAQTGKRSPKEMPGMDRHSMQKGPAPKRVPGVVYGGMRAQAAHTHAYLKFRKQERDRKAREGQTSDVDLSFFDKVMEGAREDYKRRDSRERSKVDLLQPWKKAERSLVHRRKRGVKTKGAPEKEQPGRPMTTQRGLANWLRAKQSGFYDK